VLTDHGIVRFCRFLAESCRTGEGRPFIGGKTRFAPSILQITRRRYRGLWTLLLRASVAPAGCSGDQFDPSPFRDQERDRAFHIVV